MASIVAARRFVEDLARIWSERIVQDVTRAVQAIATFPRIGSSEIAPSISEEFGKDVMKVVVGPVGLIYEYDEATDTVYLYGLIHDCGAHQMRLCHPRSNLGGSHGNGLHLNQHRAAIPS